MNKSTPDYYPRMKIGHRWYLIVPEIRAGSHEGCAFVADEDYIHDMDSPFCKLCKTRTDAPKELDLWDRWDCGDRNTIFVKPSKFREYLAARALKVLEGT